MTSYLITLQSAPYLQFTLQIVTTTPSETHTSLRASEETGDPNKVRPEGTEGAMYVIRISNQKLTPDSDYNRIPMRQRQEARNYSYPGMGFLPEARTRGDSA
ncbi:unnamed protein product [Haemonchus placei]|uniref:Uncharacterized protein n=1 Tax=Haemonchus placei TaxID=6290 RepID=A0A0N4VUF1_HAEPC|nr:unnamed protein product [Haemonchus placei]